MPRSNEKLLIQNKPVWLWFHKHLYKVAPVQGLHKHWLDTDWNQTNNWDNQMNFKIEEVGRWPKWQSVSRFPVAAAVNFAGMQLRQRKCTYLYLRGYPGKCLIERIGEIVCRVSAQNEHSFTYFGQVDCKWAAACCLPDTTFATNENPSKAILVKDIFNCGVKGFHDQLRLKRDHYGQDKSTTKNIVKSADRANHTWLMGCAIVYEVYDSYRPLAFVCAQLDCARVETKKFNS